MYKISKKKSFPSTLTHFECISTVDKKYHNKNVQLFTLVPCDESEYQCRNGLCVLKEDQCNGYKDCLDGSDEQNCSSCQAGTFQ